MAVNARGAVSEVPSVLSSLLFSGNRESGIGIERPRDASRVARPFRFFMESCMLRFRFPIA